ncbi:MAG TPA: hypothetical protein VKZ83_01215 [Phototrophicaceae bacterium]|nr:hypothetical protein [Phototrophicaceae bacterium]
MARRARHSAPSSTAAGWPARSGSGRGAFEYVAASEREEPEEQSRDLAIVLDLLAAHAAGTAHLLDPRYEFLLPSAEEREVARAARELYARLGQLDGGWVHLRTALEDLGGGRAP